MLFRVTGLTGTSSVSSVIADDLGLVSKSNKFQKDIGKVVMIIHTTIHW